MESILQFCEELINRSEPVMNQTIIPIKVSQPEMPENQLTINRMDIENLSNYVQIWTDTILVEEVERQYKESTYEDFDSFMKDNQLYHTGFFYVKVNTNLSALEFFNLLSKIPWDSLKSPGLNQISYASIAQVLGEKSETVAIQLMVLGDYLKFWQLINPYLLMSQTSETTRLLLSGMGNLAIYIPPKFIENCKELIETVNLEEPV